MLRTILMVALLIAPLAWNPASVAAQERGLVQAAAATAHAESVAGWKNSAGKQPKDLPRGVTQVFGGDQLSADGPMLPPGMSRTRDVSDDGDQTDGGDDGDGGDGDECGWELVSIDGKLWLQDCNGNLVDPLGG